MDNPQESGSRQNRASVNLSPKSLPKPDSKVLVKEQKKKKQREQKCWQKIEALDKTYNSPRSLSDNFLALFKKYPEEIDLYLQNQYGTTRKQTTETHNKDKQDLGRDNLPPVIFDHALRSYDYASPNNEYIETPVKGIWYPTNISQVQAVILEAEKNGLKVRAIGSALSPLPSSLLASSSYLIDSRGLNKVPLDVELFLNNSQKEVIRDEILVPPSLSSSQKSKGQPPPPIFFQTEAGATLREVNAALEARHLALPTQPSCDQITIAGAISTGSYGSGRFIGCVSDYVASIELVGGGGKVYRVEPTNGITDPTKFSKNFPEYTLIQDSSTFHATTVSLGCFGLITSVVLIVERQYFLKETIDHLSWQTLCKQLRKGAFNSKKPKDRSQIYLNPYPTIQSSNSIPDHFGVIFSRRYSAKESSVTSDEKRRYFSTSIFPNLAGVTSTQGSSSSLTLGEKRLTDEIVNTCFRVFPEHTHEFIDLVLKNLIDRNYTSLSHKVLNYSLNDVATKWTPTISAAFPVVDVERFISVVDTLLQYIREKRVDGFVTFPICLRFVEESTSILMPTCNGPMCYIEISCLPGTHNGIPLLQFLQAELVKLGGIPHWALRLLPVPHERIKEYYPNFETWTKAFTTFNGPKFTFSNFFTDELYGHRPSALPPSFNFKLKNTQLGNSNSNIQPQTSAQKILQPQSPSQSQSQIQSPPQSQPQPQPQPQSQSQSQSPLQPQAHPRPGELQHQMTLGPFTPPIANMDDGFKGDVRRFQPSEISRDFPHLAKGSFGIVFKGKVAGIDAPVAIKDMDIQDERSIQDWRKEIAAMNQNRCPYVVNVHGYSSDRNILTIIMEYMSRGDLFNLLHKKTDVPLSMIQRLRMSRHAALSVSYLHQNHVMHRDIKSMNFLVAEDFSCKLTDFGCAKLTSERQLFNTLNTGTPLWMAPEVKRGQYNFSADIYSLGLVLYELFERKLPGFDQVQMVPILPQIFQSSAVVLPCVNLIPDRRPTAPKVVQLLDTMIQNIVKLVRDVLPKPEQEKLHKDAKAALAEEEVDPSKRDILEMEFTQLYNHLLAKPPYEVDQLILKAFANTKKN